jgi:uncharacterized membrane protein YfcA
MIDIHNLSPWLLLVAPVVVIVAYTVFGLSGFGSTVISVPLLAHFLPVAWLVPMMALLDLCSAILMGRANREHVAKEELKRILPFMFLGFVIGVTTLVFVPDKYLRTAVGVFSILIGVNSMVNPVLHKTISRWWAIPAGLVGGAVATVFGAGGPIYATYLSGRMRDKTQIRATIATLISISAFSRAVMYAIAGLLLQWTIWVGAVVLSPFVWVGLKLGNRIHVGLTQEQMRRTVGAIVTVTGVSLVVRALL